jgi:hypothetical protein
MSEQACTAEWGNCGDNPTQWGKPTDTPHRCMGNPGHASKLHVCSQCGVIGHWLKPIEISKAGKELKKLINAMNNSKGIKTEVTVA